MIDKLSKCESLYKHLNNQFTPSNQIKWIQIIIEINNIKLICLKKAKLVMR